jgi:hypothetical protein
MNRRDFIAVTAGALTFPLLQDVPAQSTARRYLYIATPGIRNYVRYGGVGVLVYDIDNGYKFVRRIPTWNVTAGAEPENVKGIVASATTGRLYVTTVARMACIDLVTDKILWDKAPEGGCDRPSISPDGRMLFTPSFEGPHWNVIDAATGDTVKKIVLNNRAHNTVVGLDGKWVYLEGLTSNQVHMVNPATLAVEKTVGPFADHVRPFTINGKQTRVYVNCDNLLGFEIGDITTGRKLHHVEVPGFQKGPVDRHGCPSHGIGLTPDETEVWVSDGHNKSMHVFDNTVVPPRLKTTLKLRDQPGWITFSIDGRHAWPSTGEVFDTKTKKLIVSLKDEEGRDVGSEKVLEVDFDGKRVVRTGDQFAIGQKK